MRRHPGAERLGEVDARAPPLDAPAPRRRVGDRVRKRRLPAPARGTAAGEPRVGRGVVLQAHVAGREPELLRPLLRDDPAPVARGDPAHPRAGRVPARAARRADGGPVARHAAEDRACPRAPHRARPAPARRADDRPRPALEARGAGVHPLDPRAARRDDPALHPRHGRGRGAGRPHRDPARGRRSSASTRPTRSRPPTAPTRSRARSWPPRADSSRTREATSDPARHRRRCAAS